MIDDKLMKARRAYYTDKSDPKVYSFRLPVPLMDRVKKYADAQAFSSTDVVLTALYELIENEAPLTKAASKKGNGK